MNIISNSGRKLLWFEITKILTAVKNNFTVSFVIIFGALSLPILKFSGISDESQGYSVSGLSLSVLQQIV